MEVIHSASFRAHWEIRNGVVLQFDVQTLAKCSPKGSRESQYMNNASKYNVDRGVNPQVHLMEGVLLHADLHDPPSIPAVR
jgi:hypothetical protein